MVNNNKSNRSVANIHTTIQLRNFLENLIFSGFYRTTITQVFNLYPG